MSIRHLAAVIGQMSDRGAWPSVIVCDGLTTPPDIGARLDAAGWIPVFSDRNMWTRHPAVVPHLDPSLRVEAVTPESALDAVRLETDVFGLMPQEVGEQAELLADSAADGTTRAFLLRLDGRVSRVGASGARSTGRGPPRDRRRRPSAPARLRQDAHGDCNARRPRDRAQARLAICYRGEHAGRRAISLAGLPTRICLDPLGRPRLIDFDSRSLLTFRDK